MYKRILNINQVLDRKSLFLLGPRQSGKSTFLKKNYPKAFTVDLLKTKDFLKYKTNPSSFGEEIEYQIKHHQQNLFVIDEIQKIPELLDEVHRLIEEYKNSRFILTGSSARKLKKSGVNLLGGRASRFYFHPIVSVEYGIEKFVKNLTQILNFGLLPSILNSKDPWADLDDYVALYLKEEIQQEAIVRSLEGFSRFLTTVAMTNGQLINFNELANDAQIAPRTVRDYYQVLEDTLTGHLLPPFENTSKRKSIRTAKFYLFDPGVANFLLGRKTLFEKTPEFGGVFEHMIFCELKAYLDYYQISDSLFFWRSTSQFEVDFLVRTPKKEWIGIEVKSSASPSKRDFRGLLALEEDLKLKQKIIVCLTDKPRTNEGIDILPLQVFLHQLWSGKLIGVN